MDISKANIVIATHYLVYGAPQAFREYLLEENVGKLTFIAHPLQVDDSRSYKENIHNGQVREKEESPKRSSIGIVNYIHEFYLTSKWIKKEKVQYDLWVGVDSLNAFAGIVFRKLGRVKRVVYYTIDYVPHRFDNKLLNNIYHWLDKYCVRHSDETWNVSCRIAEGREKVRGLKQETYNKQVVVPIGVWLERVKRLPFEKVKKHQLLFVGNLLEKQGVQLVLDVMPQIIEKIPDFHFLIVGGGDYEDALQQKVDELKLRDHVTFTGWIKEREKLDQMMADSAIAIAMYDKQKDTFTYYADPTKLKDYLSAGLPILLTDVPHNAQEIQDNGCGIIIDYNKDRIAAAVIKILQDEAALKSYRENALRYIRQFEWRTIFKQHLNN